MGNKARQRTLGAKSAIDAQMQAAWDVNGWTTYSVTGRILPERCMVQLSQKTCKAISGSTRVIADIQIVDSHVSLICNSEDPISSFQLSDIARNVLFFPVDYIAFVNRAYYDVILDTWRNEVTGEVGAFAVYEPFLEPAKEGHLFRPGEMTFDIPYTYSNSAFTTALHDLGQAVRFPRRTVEYCRMAIEAVRHHFDPPDVANGKMRWAEGEKAMCAALRIKRAHIQRLDGDAAPARHGETPYDLDWERRSSALELGWEIVFRFRRYLEGDDTSKWSTI